MPRLKGGVSFRGVVVTTATLMTHRRLPLITGLVMAPRLSTFHYDIKTLRRQWPVMFPQSPPLRQITPARRAVPPTNYTGGEFAAAEDNDVTGSSVSVA